MPTVHVLDTHDWLFESLTQGQDERNLELVGPGQAHRADFVIFPVPSAKIAEARVRLSRLSPRLWTKLFVYSTMDLPVMWAPGVYTSPHPRRARSASFRGGGYIVDYHRDEGMRLVVAPLEKADVLWSFVGTIDTHPATRKPLFEMQDPRAFVRENVSWPAVAVGWRESGDAALAFELFANSIHRSKFVVCPRGVGSSSKRLFETMAMGRCPVVVSDDWLPPPFVQWESCSVRVKEAEVGDIPTILRGLEHRAADLGLRARTEWERHFAPEQRLRYLVHACADIESTGGATPERRFQTLVSAFGSRSILRTAKARLAGRITR